MPSAWFRRLVHNAAPPSLHGVREDPFRRSLWLYRPMVASVSLISFRMKGEAMHFRFKFERALQASACLLRLDRKRARAR